MQRQLTFSEIEHSNLKRKTKREQFLEKMENSIPWKKLCEIVEPFYYKNKVGRKPQNLEKMIRMYLLQIWYSLSDEGLEDSIYDSIAMQRFMGLDFCKEGVPDATTLLKFRRIIEDNKLGEKIFNTIKELLENEGKIIHGGTIVDATIIEAATSTKNKSKKRDEQMHSTKKGNQWYYGAKAHIGTDTGRGFVHSVSVTAANVHDITEAHNLIREDDEKVFGDAGYVGIEERDEIKNDEHLKNIEYSIAKRPEKVKKIKENIYRWADAKEEYLKTKVRCKVEHAFHIMKCIFKFKKLCYKGIKKNLNRLYVTFAMVNMYKLSLEQRVVH